MSQKQAYKTISPKELKSLREELLQKQDHKCAICGVELYGDALNQHVDHQHCFKSEELGVNGAGLIRGVLCRNCNALEGKIWNNAHRYGVTDCNDPVGSRVEFLKNLIEYYNNNYQHQENVLHPSEKRIEKLEKRTYNKLLKWYKSKDFAYKRNGELKAFPKFTGKITPKIRGYMKQAKGEGWEL